MKNFSKFVTLPLSLFAICLIMGASVNKAQAQNSGTNTGIWDTYILIGSAPATFFVDGSHLQNAKAISFNNLDLGIYPIGGTLTLAGGLDYTAKVTTHANVCSGKLFYSIYPSGGSPTSWDSIALNYTGAYGNVVVDSITNQEWSTTNGTTNILSGLAAGNYDIQIYFTSTGSDTTANGANNCATVFTENNSGANYTASFIVASSITTLDGAGIFDTYLLLGASPNSATTTTYFAGGVHLLDLGASPFNGANLGTFTTLDTLNIAGGDDYSYKIADTGNVCGGVLYYAVYDSGGSPGVFNTVSLSYGAYGNVPLEEFGDSLITQEWTTSSSVANVLTGLAPGTYELQVYFSSTGSTTSTSNCNQTFVEFGGGANYTAMFKVTYPTGINNISDNSTWLAYPNPATSQLNISTGTNITRADKIEIFDVLGQNVYTATDVTGNPIELDMSNLNTGNYFVRITTAQGSFVRNVVKE